MEQATQIALTKQILAHIENGTTDLADDVYRNSVDVYTSPDHLKKEWDILFRDYPILVGFSCQMPEAGDYLTDDNLKLPILIIRGDDGKVRAFLNLCSHRGARLVEGVGQVKRRMICPYHAWSYNLDGEIAGVPDKKAFDGVDLKSCGLKEFPCVERDGLIWVHPKLDAPAIDLDAHLSGLSQEMASYKFADYHHYETRTIRRKMNWKMIIDTFLEPYHFAVLHKDTVAPILIPNMCLLHTFGKNLRETFPRRTITDVKSQDEKDWDLVWHTAIVYVLFPNTVFVMQADHAEVWRIYPDGDDPDSSVIFLDFYIPEPALTEKARQHWDKNMDLVIEVVQEEDFPIGEGVQFALHSGGMQEQIYGRNEPALQFFEKTVTEAVA